jgi:predicted TIM-barrel fold metal-dependent hydrolase
MAHVFGPSDRFPYADGRGYTPPDCPVESYIRLLDTLGIDRGVIVHGSAHGADNRASLDAIARYPDRLRGVAVVRPEATEDAVAALAAAGMRGFRLSNNLVGAVRTEFLEPMADRVAPFGWHVLIHVDTAAEFVALAPRLRRLKIDVMIDHMGRARGGDGADSPGFRAVLALLRETDHCWVKLASWYRLSDADAPYDDMTPLARALIETRPDRVVWGSNWPHPILWDRPMPNDGDLLDQVMGWAGDAATLRRILVDNPARLYGFPPAA